MLKRILKKADVFKEYYGELKFIYTDLTLEVINYESIISIDDVKVCLKEVTVNGYNFKIIYQDPVKIIIKGAIDSIMIKGKNGL